MEFRGNYIDDDLINSIQKTSRYMGIGNIIREKLGVLDFNSLYLFDRKIIERESNSLFNLLKREIEDPKGGRNTWLGEENPDIRPGFIDPEKMLVIGNFDYDVPICLDFRTSDQNPSVIALINGFWMKISISYSSFLADLGVL